MCLALDMAFAGKFMKAHTIAKGFGHVLLAKGIGVVIALYATLAGIYQAIALLACHDTTIVQRTTPAMLVPPIPLLMWALVGTPIQVAAISSVQTTVPHSWLESRLVLLPAETFAVLFEPSDGQWILLLPHPPS